MAALSLVLLNFRSAIELPVTKIYPPAKPAITAIIYNIIMTTKFVEYYILANDNVFHAVIMITSSVMLLENRLACDEYT